jgi:hypothetical protein
LAKHLQKSVLYSFKWISLFLSYRNYFISHWLINLFQQILLIFPQLTGGTPLDFWIILSGEDKWPLDSKSEIWLWVLFDKLFQGCWNVLLILSATGIFLTVKSNIVVYFVWCFVSGLSHAICKQDTLKFRSSTSLRSNSWSIPCKNPISYILFYLGLFEHQSLEPSDLIYGFFGRNIVKITPFKSNKRKTTRFADRHVLNYFLISGIRRHMS